MPCRIAPVAAAVVAALAACGTVPPAPAAPAEGPACPAVDVADAPELLSATGAFGACARAYAPRFALWSDGAEKRRFVYLPDGAAIDDSDVDAWQMPVGTRLWKEFKRDGVLVETRMLWRTKAGWIAAAYLWNDDGTDAQKTTEAVVHAKGTGDDVPDPSMCQQCHAGNGEFRPLGFSAVELAGSGGDVTLDTLFAEGRLQHTPRHIAIPGTPAQQEALGWLHANCGSCHRDGGLMADNPMRLALTLGALGSLAETPVMRTAAGMPSQDFPGRTLLVPGAPDQSLVFERATARDGDGGMQMPPIGTEIVDPHGKAALAAFIAGLPL